MNRRRHPLLQGDNFLRRDSIDRKPNSINRNLIEANETW